MVAQTRGNSEHSANANYSWTVVVPLFLTLALLLFSPLLYDFSQWLRAAVGAL